MIYYTNKSKCTCEKDSSMMKRKACCLFIDLKLEKNR